MNDHRQIAFIIHSLDSQTPTHFAHLYDLLEVVGKKLAVHLIVERGSKPLGNFASVTVLKSKGIWRLVKEISVLKKLHQQGCDKFYVHYSFSGAMAAGLVSRLWGGVSYYWNCGMPWLFVSRLAGKNWASWFKSRLPLQLALRLPNYIVTGTNGLSRMYSREYGLAASKFKVMPNWISLTRFAEITDKRTARDKFGLPQDQPIVLFVHRLSPRKGANLLVPIARALKNTGAFFVVAGNGPYREKLEKEIKNNNLQSRFKIMGDVPNIEIPKLMAGADVFLMPSMEEGFPRVLLEAMAIGVPFVASNVGGVVEIVPAGSAMVASGDISGFAAEVDKLLDDPILAGQRVKSGREKVKQYDLATVAQKFIELVG